MAISNDMQLRRSTTTTAGDGITLALGRTRMLVDAAVETSGPATLTVEVSHSGDFSGEEVEVISTEYDAAIEQIEQFPTAYTYVRATVDQNLTRLSLVSSGADA